MKRPPADRVWIWWSAALAGVIVGVIVADLTDHGKPSRRVPTTRCIVTGCGRPAHHTVKSRHGATLPVCPAHYVRYEETMA